MMIKNIVFDMGNVLVYFQAERYLQKYPEHQKTLNNEVFRSVEWLQVDRGVLTEQEAVCRVCARLPQYLHSTVEDLFCNWHEDIPPVEGMNELVKDLTQAGYRLYLCSNTGKEFCNFRRHIEVLSYFAGEFISANWQLLKPDENLYRAFYSHFNLVPDECFFIDDSPPNIESARRTGMQGVVFNNDVTYLRQQLKSFHILE